MRYNWLLFTIVISLDSIEFEIFSNLCYLSLWPKFFLIMARTMTLKTAANKKPHYELETFVEPKKCLERPLCRKYCQYGFKKAADGCYTSCPPCSKLTKHIIIIEGSIPSWDWFLWPHHLSCYRVLPVCAARIVHAYLIECCD